MTVRLRVSNIRVEDMRVDTEEAGEWRVYVLNRLFQGVAECFFFQGLGFFRPSLYKTISISCFKPSFIWQDSEFLLWATLAQRSEKANLLLGGCRFKFRDY